ncbi:MAG TPA: DUF692 family protein [Trueperaceae bacterium]|nr:DUF692 family protein [Trueperaceae bacterium]
MSAPRLAVNYSPALASLVAAGEVSIDVYKVPDWDDLIAAAGEGACYVHFPTDLGATSLGIDVARSVELMNRTGTCYLNAHVAPSRERFPDVAVGDVGAEARRAVAAALVADVEALAAAVGAERVIVENIPFRGEEHALLRAGVDPRVIADVVAATGCGLLLDLSHALLTARATGQDLWSYVDALPTYALRELHVSGVRPVEGRLRDHLPLTADDVATFRAALGRVRAGAWPAPETVAFEYGGVGPVFEWRTDRGVLAEQVPLLRELLAA